MKSKPRTNAQKLQIALDLLDNKTLQDLRCGLILDPHMCAGSWMHSGTHQSHCLFGAAVVVSPEYAKRLDEESIFSVPPDIAEVAYALYETHPVCSACGGTIHPHEMRECWLCGSMGTAMDVVISWYDGWAMSNHKAHKFDNYNDVFVLTKWGRNMVIKWIENILHKRAEKPECKTSVTAQDVIDAVTCAF